MLLYILYLLPSYCLLLPMLFHLVLDNCQKEIKLGLTLFSGKLLTRGCCFQIFPMEELISAADKKLFRQMTSNRHCLHSLLPTPKMYQSTKFIQKLRAQRYQLPQIEYDLFKKSFLSRCLFSYM